MIISQTIETEIGISASQLEPVSGGLFNRVARARSQESGAWVYLKQFADRALSGNFPLLPTTADQRYQVAKEWHLQALAASTAGGSAHVPRMIAADDESQLLAMSEVPGAPLYDAIVGRAALPAHVLRSVIEWLGAFHKLNSAQCRSLEGASAPFKAFKIDLQYTKILSWIDDSLHANATQFINEYIGENKDPVHGDINSRNIFYTDNSISVIDFEQGHLGNGVYDLAYIVCEYVIHDILHGKDPKAMIDMSWQAYARARGWSEPESAQRGKFHQHLLFQTLYRLYGPSRAVWTGHLSEDIVEKIATWGKSEARIWLA